MTRFVTVTIAIILIIGVEGGISEITVESSPCCDMAGDANDDYGLGIGDPVYTIGYIFKGGPAPPCLDEADYNGDCTINIEDVVDHINYIFRGGPPPVCGCVLESE